MNDTEARDVVCMNLDMLARNPYPGRGIVMGTDQDSKYAVQVYWIMGRSEGSRNRIFKYDSEGRLFTEPADPAKVKNQNDLALIIYNAMKEDYVYGNYVVTNGSQTDHIIHGVKCMPESTLRDCLQTQLFEPDEPNFTPRISGQFRFRHGQCHAELSLLRRCQLVRRDDCVRSYYDYTDIAPGFGFCVTTYAGDGNPLPQFEGDPYPMPIIGNIDQVLNTYWNNLNQDNKVSVAVKFIDLKTGKSEIKVINKLVQVETPKVEEAAAVPA
jgi:hypothetical protein